MTTSDRTVRWGALATTVGGAVFVAEGSLSLTDQQTMQNVLLALSYLLVAGGLLGFHELQRRRCRLLERIGFYATIVGWGVALVGHTAALEAPHGIGFLLAMVGYLLYGVATFRARILPRWSGVAIAVAGPISLLAGEYTTVPFGLFWIVLGYLLWSRASRRPESDAARTRVVASVSALVLALAVLAAGALAGCGGSDAGDETAAKADKLLLEATEAKGRYAIEGPRSARAGAVQVTLANRSSKPREAQLICITGDHNVEEAIKAIAGATQGAPVPAWLRWAGGAGETMPGKSTTFAVDLRPGRYYALDTTSGEGKQAKLRAALGAVAAIQVTKAKRPAQLPPASASITATEYAFDAKNLAAGRSTVELHNAGREQHHFVLAPILKARTFADVKKFATSDEESGAPPVDFENQIISGVMDGGEKQVMPMNLKAGRYALFCFVSDRVGGPPHVAKGMLTQVAVR